jgi:23S rRNA (uracil1939-C5)-methyltransferase
LAKTQRTHDLFRGQHVKVKIASLAGTGHGVSKEFGIPIFIDRTAPGDVIQAELFDVRKDFAKGQLLEVIEPSPQRAEPPCKIFKVCGGCQWQHLSYQAQLDNKQDIVRQALKYIAGLDSDVVLPTIAPEDNLHYRNKVQFPVRGVRNEARIRAGYFKQNSHELVNINHCPIQPEPLDRMLEAVKGACEHFGITAYDETIQRGFLRHITARYSFAQNRCVVTLVVNADISMYPELTPLDADAPVSDEMDDPVSGKVVAQEGRDGKVHKPAGSSKAPSLADLKDVAFSIMDFCQEVTGVCLNFNAAAGNRIFGNVTALMAGDPYVIEKLATKRSDFPPALQKGVDFRLSPTSFFQVNTKGAERLLETIIDVAAKTFKTPPNELKIPLSIDVYAGVGTMTTWLAAISEQVIAIEEFAAAVSDGKANIAQNGITNVEFREGKAEAVLSELKDVNLAPDLILIDPPRKGATPEALSALISLSPKAIIYVSCNPATLARDLKLLQEFGYKAKEIQPVDMFPQTFHVETVTLLEKIIR